MKIKKKHLVEKRRRRPTRDPRIKETKLIGDTPEDKPFAIDEVNQYFFPFCLYIGYQKEFLMYKGDTLITYRVQCPDCGQTFNMKTLMSDMSIMEFADWVADYARQGFWQKCDFEKFNQRLKQLGWSYLFWERYRAVTGKADDYRYERVHDRIKEDNALDSGRYERKP